MIDVENATVEQLLHLVRTEPVGSPYFTGQQGEDIVNRLAFLRDQDILAYVEASKRIGWPNGD